MRAIVLWYARDAIGSRCHLARASTRSHCFIPPQSDIHCSVIQKHYLTTANTCSVGCFKGLSSGPLMYGVIHFVRCCFRLG